MELLKFHPFQSVLLVGVYYDPTIIVNVGDLYG
jgi:hypothetical protein